MKILDLFCGAGGFSCGFLDKGNTFIGVDNWEVALETYKNNIKGEIIKTDIMLLDLSTVGKVDILVGSPPCQPHSTANRFKDNDPKHIQKYLDVVNELKPRWWVMEEVPGAVKTGLISKHLQRFIKASDVGLPHVRNRLFAGNYPDIVKKQYNGEKWFSDDKKHSSAVIPTPQTNGIQFFGYERDRGYPAAENLKKMIKTPIAQMRGYYHGKEDKERMTVKLNQLLPTITAGAGCHCAVAGDQFKLIEAAKSLLESPDEPRSFGEIVTVDFCAWVMGFPEWYKFSGKKSEQFKQIGNAVCPPVSRAIWNAIKNPSCILGNL